MDAGGGYLGGLSGAGHPKRGDTAGTRGRELPLGGWIEMGMNERQGVVEDGRKRLDWTGG